MSKYIKALITAGIAMLGYLLLTVAVAHARTSISSLNLMMTWIAPTTNTDGSELVDLAGYHICISVNTPVPADLKFADMGTACTVTAMVDADAEEADGVAPVVIDSTGIIYVRIAAYDTSNNVSDFSNQAALNYDVQPADGASIVLLNIKLKKAAK